MALGKPDDTVYHLIESEKLLRDSKTYSDVGIGKLVVRAAFERNNDLNMKARALQKKQKSSTAVISRTVSLKQKRQEIAEQDRKVNALVTSSVFVVSFIACKLALDWVEKNVTAIEI